MGYLATLAPFLVGLASGWVVLRLVRWPVTAVRSGLLVAMLTWAVGLLLRATLWQDGTAIAFVVVAGVFLLGTMVGWRVLVTSVGRRARGRSEELTGQAAVVGRDG